MAKMIKEQLKCLRYQRTYSQFFYLNSIRSDSPFAAIEISTYHLDVEQTEM